MVHAFLFGLLRWEVPEDGLSFLLSFRKERLGVSIDVFFFWTPLVFWPNQKKDVFIWIYVFCLRILGGKVEIFFPYPLF